MASFPSNLFQKSPLFERGASTEKEIPPLSSPIPLVGLGKLFFFWRPPPPFQGCFSTKAEKKVSFLERRGKKGVLVRKQPCSGLHKRKGLHSELRCNTTQAVVGNRLDKKLCFLKKHLRKLEHKINCCNYTAFQNQYKTDG